MPRHQIAQNYCIEKFIESKVLNLMQYNDLPVISHGLPLFSRSGFEHYFSFEQGHYRVVDFLHTRPLRDYCLSPLTV